MTATGQHLVVLVHGLHGTVADLEFVGAALRRTYGDQIVVLAPDVNHGRTRTGIESMTERLFAALMKALDDGSAAGSARYVSIIGHSLGGLVARRLAYFLHRAAVVPARLRPMALVTVATPHLGSRHHARWSGVLSLHRVGGAVAALALGQTGRELFLSDVATGPILQVMTDDAHLDALRLFRVRVLYACAHSDMSVGYATAALCRRNLHRKAAAGGLIELADDEDDGPDAKRSLLDSVEQRLCDRLRSVRWRRYVFVPPRPVVGHLDVIVTSPDRAPYGAVVVEDIVRHLGAAIEA